MAFQQSGDKLMTYTPPAHGVGLFNLWRLAGWATIAGLIALPAIAMQFTTEVNWGAEDFAFAVVMLGGVGLAFEPAEAGLIAAEQPWRLVPVCCCYGGTPQSG
jgi:hypothetical protein